MDLIVARGSDRTEWLNVMGVDSEFHRAFGYYADPVEEKTAVVPKGWKGRLVNLPAGDTEGVLRLCLEPHDLAISKYVARREKDIRFNRELVRLGLLNKEKLLTLLPSTPVPDETRTRLRACIDRDLDDAAARPAKSAKR